MREEPNLWFLREEVQRFMEHALEKGPDFAPVWIPPCDVFETESSIVVVMEIAGVALDEVEVLVKGQKLIVQGVRKEIPSPLKKDYHLMEINFGPFYREIELRSSIDASAVQALYRQGFLIIECRKRVSEEKRIPVS